MTSTELYNAYVGGLSEREQRLAVIWACRYLDIVSVNQQMHDYYERLGKTEPASPHGAFQHTEPSLEEKPT